MNKNLQKELEKWRQFIDNYIRSNFKPNLEQSVLDIGIGESNNILRPMYPQLKTLDRRTDVKADIQVDIETKEAGQALSWINLGVFNHFDLIFCLEVLEHCEKPWNVPSSLFFPLKHTGKLIVSVPCFLFEHQMHPVCNDNLRYMPGYLPRFFGSDWKCIDQRVCADQAFKPLGQIVMFEKVMKVI